MAEKVVAGGALIATSYRVQGTALGHVLLVCAAASILPLYLSMFRLSLGSVILRAADFVALGVILGSLLFTPGALRAAVKPPFLAIYALVLYILCQGALQDRLGPSVKESVQLLFVTATVIAIGVQLERDPPLFLRALVAFALVSMALTLAVHLSQGYFYRYKFAGDGKYVFGLTSALLLLVAYSRQWRWFWVLMFLASLVPLLASLERKGPLGVAVIGGLLLCHWLLQRTRVHVSILLLLGTVGLCAVALAWHEQIGHYLQRIQLENYFVDEDAALWESNTHRRALLLNGWDIFTHNWLWGTGADSVRLEMRAYFADPRLANGTHNFYLDNLIKYGVAGSALLFGAVLSAFVSCRRSHGLAGASALLAAYLLFVITFISEGTAVTLMALLPTVLGPLFGAAALTNSEVGERLRAGERTVV